MRDPIMARISSMLSTLPKVLSNILFMSFLHSRAFGRPRPMRAAPARPPRRMALRALQAMSCFIRDIADVIGAQRDQSTKSNASSRIVPLIGRVKNTVQSWLEFASDVRK